MSSKKSNSGIKSAQATFSKEGGNLPSLFSHTIKDTNKIGNKKFAPKKKYIKPDIEIGNKIVGKDADLEGFGDVIAKVKKEDVQMKPGAMRKHKMVKQLSGRFNTEDRKTENMEFHKKKAAEAKKRLAEQEGKGGAFSKPAGVKLKLTAGTRSTLSGSAHLRNSNHNKSNLSGGTRSFGKDKIKRKKFNILALVDDAIENDPTEEAKQKAVARKAAADAPIPDKLEQEQEEVEKAKEESSPVETKPEVESSADNVVVEPPKESSPEPPTKEETPKAVSTTTSSNNRKSKSAGILGKIDNAIDSSSSVPPMFASAGVKASSSTPAWKTRLKSNKGKYPPKPQQAPKAVVLKPIPKKEPEAESEPPIEEPEEDDDDDDDSVSISSAESDASSAVETTPAETVQPPTPVEIPVVVETPPVEIKPVVVEKKPPVEIKPVVVEKKPRVEIKPVVVEKKPPVEIKPVVVVTKPVEIKPVVVEKKPVEIEPVVVEKKPVEIKQVVVEKKTAVTTTFSKPPQTDSDSDSDSDSDDDSDNSPSKRATTAAPKSVLKPVSEPVRESASVALKPAFSLEAFKKDLAADSKRDADTKQEEKEEDSGEVAPVFQYRHYNGLEQRISTASAEELRQQIKETEKKLEASVINAKLELADMKKKGKTDKEKLRIEYTKTITAQRKINEKQDKKHQKVVEEEKSGVDKLRAESKRLRATQERLPKQMAEVRASDQALQTANEEISGHFEELSKFAKKLQADHDRLAESSRQCKDEYLPRYRHELWERQLFLDTETKIKNLYRDCMIKLAKQIEKARQPALIEEVSHMVLETEADINPKFDPKLLFADDSDSDSDSDTSSDSSSSSDSDSDSD